MQVRRGAITVATLLGVILLSLGSFSVWVSNGISEGIDAGEPPREHGMGTGLTPGQQLVVGTVIVGGTVALLAGCAAWKRPSRTSP